MVPMTVSGLIPEALSGLMEKKTRGEILMVNSSGVYFVMNDKIRLLSPFEFGAVPIGIAAEHFDMLTETLVLERGQQVSFSENTMYAPGGIVRFHFTVFEEKGITAARLDGFRYKGGIRILAECGKTKGLAMLYRPLLLGGTLKKTDSPYCFRALSILEKILDGICKNASEEVEASIPGLLGLGCGLTPSGDDVLMGLIYGLKHSLLREKEAVRELCEAVLSEAPGRTNRISCACLEAVISGVPFERLSDVWLGLFGQGPAAEVKLLEIGSNSGAEMLLGLLLAAKCIANITGESIFGDC